MSEISVIVPVYNTALYLENCVDSILRQSCADFELILVDDGSTDGSGVICDEYAKKDARVRVLHWENAGQSAARNRGVQAAKTELLCFIDADDVAHPDLLSVLYGQMREADAGISIAARVRGETPPDDFFLPVETETRVLKIDEDCLLRLFNENDTIYWTPFPCLLQKRIYTQYPLAEGKVMEDNAVSCKWLTAARTVAQITTPLYFYRNNPTGTMASSFSKKNLDYLWALEEQLGFYESRGFTALQGAVAKHYVETAVWFAARVKTELNDPRLAKETIKKAVEIRKKYTAYCQLTPAEERKLLKAAHPYLFRIKKKLRLS